MEYNLEYAADYYPYGKILREFRADTKAEKYLTTHHERDDETGLDYRGARYYDADIARFLSLDPDAADYVSWSPYNYVFSNPAILTDPTGKGPWNPIAGIGAGIASSFTSSLNKLTKNISEFADDVGDWWESGDNGQIAGDTYVTPDAKVATKESETKNLKHPGRTTDIEGIIVNAKSKSKDPKKFNQGNNGNIKDGFSTVGDMVGEIKDSATLIQVVKTMTVIKVPHGTSTSVKTGPETETIKVTNTDSIPGDDPVIDNTIGG
jgi:RHS repeat-associated protein